MLSFSQVRIALLQLYYYNKPIYNISFTCNILGNLNLDILEKCLNYILIRYPQLKTNVKISDDKLIKTQNINKKIIIQKCFHDNYINQQNSFIDYTFNLSEDILIKVLYIDKTKQLIFLFSDLIIYGFTILIFFRELSNIYNNLFSKIIPKLNYITPIKPKLNTDKLPFWKNILLNNNNFNIFVKNNTKNFNENRIHFTINQHNLIKIKHLIQKLNITLFDYFTSIYLLLLHIITGEDEITVDTLFTKYIDDIGLFNDVVLLPIQFNETIKNMNFYDYLTHYSKNLLQIKNNIISLEYLCNKLKFSNLPNIRIHFEYSNKNTQKSFKFGDSQIESNFYENSANQIRQLITFNLCEFNNKIDCYFSYKKDCFDSEYIQHIIQIITDITNNKNIILKNIINNYNIKNYYSIPYQSKKDIRLLSYSFAGNYPDIKYSDFKKMLDNF